MKIVCDSSALIVLARIGRLDILKKMVKALLIPQAVYEDIVVKGTSRAGEIEVRKAKWIEKRNVSNRELVRKLNVSLGLGESEAIALAKKIKADLIILDDQKARKTAILEGLRVAGC